MSEHQRPKKKADKRPSDIDCWVLKQFGGVDARASIIQHAEELVRSAGTRNAPVKLSEIANLLNVNPAPIYSEGSTQGALKIVNGQLRIVLRSKIKRPPPAGSVSFRRMRFTYSHELAHALFYDREHKPPIRIAPRGCYRDEESLCNCAAATFLMPEYLLRPLLDHVAEPSLDLLEELAQLFQVSVHVVAIQSRALFQPKLHDDRVYMLSCKSSGPARTSVEKPRCVLAFVSANLSRKGVRILNPNQGIERISSNNAPPSGGWSLSVNFDKLITARPNEVMTVDEMLTCPGGEMVHFIGQHIARGSFIWTSGRVEVARLPRKLEQGAD